MEKTTHSKPVAEASPLSPPKHSTNSMILSGAGNGMMLGTIPFAALELYAAVMHKSMSRTATISSLAVAIIGSSIGAVYGAKEARELQRYRGELTHELAELRTQTDTTRSQLDRLLEKETALQHTHTQHTR